jgi:hypothetical protein
MLEDCSPNVLRNSKTSPDEVLCSVPIGTRVHGDSYRDLGPARDQSPNSVDTRQYQTSGKKIPAGELNGHGVDPLTRA